MGELSIYHWLIVIFVVILLFGARKIPELMRGLGQGIRYFKDELAEKPKQADTSVSIRGDKKST
jgi:sec-independent protein translocase protein TatA